MVLLENHQNSSIQAKGYLIVSIVDDDYLPLISISCTIARLCAHNNEYQTLNPTNQLSLYSICVDDCIDFETIQWTIYYQNPLNSTWILLNNTNLYDNIYFFGLQQVNLTTIKELFETNSEIQFWRFEVNYSFASKKISSTSINFQINSPPSNGSCSINPSTGTVLTLFEISCSNWFDSNGIQDYLLYSWTNDYSQRILIAYSPESSFQVRLPSENHFMVSIRDTLDCSTDVNISSVDISQNMTDKISTELIQILSCQNQNQVSQIIIRFAQQLNQMNNEYLNNISLDDLANVFITPLGIQRSQQVNFFFILHLKKNTILEFIG